MKRATFELGPPEVTSNKSISWTFPDGIDKNSFFEWLEKDKEEIRAKLLEKLKQDMRFFCFRDLSYYPYSPDSRPKTLLFQIEDKCGCCKIGDGLGGYFLGTHNLDGFAGLICAFNLGANVLEIYNPELIVPRIKTDKGEVILSYPLPPGFERIPESNPNLDNFLNQGGLEKNLEISRLGKPTKKDFSSTPQVIEIPEGKIEIAGGFVLGKHFTGYNICNAAYPISKLVDSCTYG